MTLVAPAWAAKCNGVQLSGMLAFAAFGMMVTRWATTASWPFWAAQQRGVLPSQSAKSGTTAFVAVSSALTVCR
ncbi:hypothetical protein N658DRAFT_500588 [Parathielavia hyrcaniae]|uniref:Uncharacterized protein n=1 Tax=Parathielavia hyrcaniae TaxID=113614 RepID=A0AAN6PXE6_9PEZI|nr:hypothetical protein N658DRAFT_500588 [Parathielavia hyrcaniae]